MRAWLRDHPLLLLASTVIVAFTIAFTVSAFQVRHALCIADRKLWDQADVVAVALGAQTPLDPAAAANPAIVRQHDLANETRRATEARLHGLNGRRPQC